MSLHLARGEVEGLDRPGDLVAHRRLGDESVVRAERGGQPPPPHLGEGMLAEVVGQLGHGLLVRGEADLDRDALVRDELGEVLDVALAVADPRARDLGLVEEPRAVADAVGVQVPDGLEDRLGAVVLAGVDGLAEEGLVRDLVGLAVVLRGVALLLPGEVDPHDEEALFPAQTRGRPGHLQARRRVDLALGRLGQGLEEPPEAEGELRGEEAHGAEDDAGREAGLLPGPDLGAAVERVGGPPQPPVHGPDDRRDVEPRPDVELGGEAHLEVAHALGLAVLGQLEGRPLEGLLVLQHRHRVLEALKVLVQVRVAGPEHQRFEPLGRLRGEGDLALAGELDERPEPERAVEVDVEVGLGEAADQVLVHERIMRPEA